MGLTIHYQLGFPATTMRKARQAVEMLRQRCLDLPFSEVGEVLTFVGEECDYMQPNQDADARWLLIQSEGNVNCAARTERRNRTIPSGGNYTLSYRVVPRTVVAFTAWPGEGCEASNLGLRLLPDRIQVRGESGNTFWLPTAEADRGWTWGSFCKTQYANDPQYGGLQHFLQCHLTVIAALDAARELGFGVTVSDEGDFWDKRSVEALAREVGAEDQHLAALMGALKDQADLDGMTVAAPITKRPDFEHLEAGGALDPALQRLIRSITDKTIK